MVQLNKQLDQLQKQRIIDADLIRILGQENKQLRQAINDRNLEFTENQDQMNELKSLVMTQAEQIARLNDQLVALKNGVDNLNNKNATLLGQIRKTKSAADSTS